MLESFCAAANIKAFLKRDDCPRVLQNCAPIVEACYGGDQRGTLMTDIRTLGNAMLDSAGIEHKDIDWKKVVQIDNSLFVTLVAAEDGRTVQIQVQDWRRTRCALQHDRCTIRGTIYSASTSNERNSIVFFQEAAGSPFVPGIICRIFALVARQENEDVQQTFLAIRRYLPSPISTDNPFRQYPDFGASIWSKTCDENIAIITVSHRICHAARLEWNSSCYVFKALEKVSDAINDTFTSVD